MSTPHALAAATRLIQDILGESLDANDVSGLVDGSATVTAEPPDRVLDESGAIGDPRLNVYLHQISFSGAYRNADLPTRDQRGQITNRPLLGLNLHYLLTAYGRQELQAETLMGFAVEALHRNAMPTRRRIQQALEGSALNMPTLQVSELARQIESIKITPETLSVDDASKLWTALQTHLRTTVFYSVSVILIESQTPKRAPLPVLTRGPRVQRRVVETFPDDHLPEDEREREAGVAVQPGLVPAVPTLEGVTYDDHQIAVRIGESITLEGHHLDGVDLRFTEARTRRTLDVRPAEVSATRVVVGIPGESANSEAPPDADPSIAANWQAGFYSVAALTPAVGEGQRERVSNELPVVLAPNILGGVGVTSEALNGVRESEFTVTCSPEVRNTQKAVLIVGEREIVAEPLPAGVAQSGTLTFRDTVVESAGFESGSEHWVRLIVDGASSIFIDRSQEPPEFIGPTVEIP